MTGVGSTPRDFPSWMRDVNKRLVAQERRRVNGATWDGISGKPTTFPPSPHTHTWADLTDPLAHNLGTIQGSRLPGEFPLGFSFGTAGADFPESIGTVINVRHSAFRQFQHFYNRNTTAAGLYIRTANGDTEWTPWVFMASKAYVDDKTWDWDTDITGKPSAFPPSSHTHTWSEVTGKPSSFPPSTHQHAATDITSGTLPVARGGTGVTVNPSLLVNLASTAAGNVFESAPRPGVTGTLPVARGGTGQTTTAAVKSAFGITALESRMSALDTDTGWVALGGLVNSFTAVSSNPPMARRIGEVVYLKGQLYRSTAPGGGTTAFVLPAQFRPPETIWYMTTPFGSGEQPVGVEVNYNGNVIITCLIPRTSGVGFSIHSSGFLAT